MTFKTFELICTVIMLACLAWIVFMAPAACDGVNIGLMCLEK